MRKKQGKIIAMLLAFVFLIQLCWDQSTFVVNAAATPTFAVTKATIVGAGETYQLTINNKVTGSTYKWSTSNSKVATITSKGLVIAVGKGTSTIKCIITYPSKKTKTITCKITVYIPAKEIRINNAVEVNGTHKMLVGDRFNFNRDIIPADSSDKTFWSIDGGDADCLRVDDATSGIVTAIKPGKVILKASAVKSATAENAANSIVNDAVIIEVVGPTATVKSADIISSTELRVVFDSPIDKSTVIGSNNKLLDSVSISMRKDTKNVLAQDPGNLTGVFSDDLKTLTITATNKFDGDYGIDIANTVKTTDGLAIEEFHKLLTYKDTIPPSIINVDLDDTGMISTIRFTEAIDFTNLKISNVTVVPTGNLPATIEATTTSILTNKLNYIISDDKKSLSINLSKIASADLGKTFSVTISGIKDMTGNAPASAYLTAYVRTDNTPKPQAQPITVTRTSYNTLTAIFNRAIKDAGMAQVSGGTMITGVVDPVDNKKVNYTISDTLAALNGYQTVYIGFWNSYNVALGDTSAQQMRSFTVDFTIDKTNPVLLSYDFDVPSQVLTLTYNKDVNLAVPSGVFTTTLETVTEDIRSGTNITYTKMASTDSKVVKLKLGNMTLLGSYTFLLDQGFVVDNFRNVSLSRSITISNINGTTNELPAPYAIIQSTTNLSQITLEFANKLDVASAQLLSNYAIAGVTIISAQVIKNTPDMGATVLLTVADGSIDVTVERPITIKGVKGYNGSFTEMSPYTTTIELKDNKKPTYIDPPVFDRTTKNTIHLNFNEEVKGTMTVKVTQISATPIEYTTTITVTGNSVNINLGIVPPNGIYLRIDIITNNITDLSGNQSTLPSTLGVLVAY